MRLMALKRLLPVIILFTLYVVGLSAVNLVRYNDGGGDVDLGAVSQILWNTRHGDFLYTSYPGNHGPIFGEHFNPVYLPLTLLYYWREDPRLLLLVQSLVLGVALFPLWGLARGALGDRPAFLLCLAYAVNPVVHYINYFEFHPVTLAVPVYLAAFYCLRQRRYRALAATLLVSLLIDESMSIILIAWGLFFAARGPRRLALPAILVGLAGYLALMLWFLPAFTPAGGNPNYFYLQYFRYLPGETGVEKLASALHHPGLVVKQAATAATARYLGLLLLGFAFLPVLVPAYGLLLLPQLGFNLLSGFGETATIHLHYNATLVAFLAAAAVAAIARMRHRCRIAGHDLAVPLAALVLVGSLAGHLIDSPLPRLGTRQFHPGGFGDPARFARARPLLQSIPPGASVGTEYKYWAYLSLRRDLFLFFDEHPPADYYLLDTRTTLVPPGLTVTDGQFIADHLARGAYELTAENDGLVLLRRSFGPAGIPIPDPERSILPDASQ